MAIIFHAAQVWHANRGVTGSFWFNDTAGVDLFFVISGFVMVISSQRLATRPDGWRVFLSRRLQRIVPLYWLLSAAKLIPAYAVPAWAPNTQIHWWNVTSSFLFIPSRDSAGTVFPFLHVGWTLEFEMLFYLLFALALWLQLPPLRVMLVTLMPLALAGMFRQPEWPALLWFCQTLVLEFIYGMVIAKMILRSGPLPGRAAAALLAVGLLCMLKLPPVESWRGVTCGISAAAVLWGSVSLERVIGPRMPALLLLLGDASYAIYLSHPFLIPVLAAADRRLQFGLPAMVVICVVASCILGVAVHLVIDKPLQVALRHRGRREKAIVPAAV